MNVVSSRESSIGHERSGYLIDPPGFERLLANLIYIPLTEYHHLIQMTVAETERLCPLSIFWQCPYFSAQSATWQVQDTDLRLTRR
jgi:hypothetical protein